MTDLASVQPATRFFSSARFVTGVLAPERFPRETLPFIIVAGRSNCGKSSLINALLNQKIARVSKTPGRTAEINFFLVGETFFLVDLPGYGFAARGGARQESWGRAIPPLFSDSRAKLLLLLMDARRALEEEEEEAWTLAAQGGCPARLVLTKADQLSRDEVKRKAARLQTEAGLELPPLVVSVKARLGIDELRAIVAAAAAGAGE